MMSNNKLTFMQKIKAEFLKAKERYQDPAHKAHRRKRAGEVIGGLVRGFILFGLCFVILLPILQKFSFALRAPEDIANPAVVWIPQTFSTVNIIISLEILKFGEALFNKIGRASC